MGGLGAGVKRYLEDIELDDFAREWCLRRGRGIGSGLRRGGEQEDIVEGWERRTLEASYMLNASSVLQGRPRGLDFFVSITRTGHVRAIYDALCIISHCARRNFANVHKGPQVAVQMRPLFSASFIAFTHTIAAI
jgi:hypothetical protein